MFLLSTELVLIAYLLLCPLHVVCSGIFTVLSKFYCCHFREKKLLVSSEDYGKDLTGVQNLRKKHQRLEAEIHNHEPKVQVDKPLRVPACVYHSRDFRTSGNTCLFK